MQNNEINNCIMYPMPLALEEHTSIMLWLPRGIPLHHSNKIGAEDERNRRAYVAERTTGRA
jgi:hypothetical protein